MFADIVMPKGNEAEFIWVASRLSIKKLLFLYDFDNYNEEKAKKTLDAAGNSGNTDTKIGFIVNQRNMDKASRHSRLLVAKSSDNDRNIIESGKVKIIYGFEEVHKKDYIHQRASGLNHILCELAAKNKVAIGFSYCSLINQSPAVASMAMGRMVQNMRLCRKYGVKTAIGAFTEKPYGLRAQHDIESLFRTLGMGDKK